MSLIEGESTKELCIESFPGDYSFKEKKLSQKLPFPRWIFLVDPNLLGVHEKAIEKKASSIDISKGWYGNPLAVTSFSERFKASLPLSGVYTLKNLKYGELGVLDGHHRHQAAIKNNLLVPVQYFPIEHPSIVIETWNGEGESLSIGDIKMAIEDPNFTFPPRATKFRMIHDDGERYGLTNFQAHFHLSDLSDSY